MTSTTEFTPLLINDKQIAALLGSHRNTVWNRVRKGLLPESIRWEAKTVWRHQDIKDFVDNLAA